MTYRNRDLLNLARLAPCCFGCGRPNDQTVVAAHSNSQIDGKGLGLKASDAAVAFVCYDCHVKIDQSKLPQEDRRQLWLDAHIATMRWLIESGKLVVAAEHVTPDPKPAPKRKVAKGRSIPSRPFQKSERKIPSRPFSRKPA